MGCIPAYRLSSPPPGRPNGRPMTGSGRGSSIPEAALLNREAAAYWVARSSRAMTSEFVAPCSPSLPRRNNLDLVAVLDRRFGPAALRQHVVIQRDREMRAFIFELAEQRI